MGRWEPRKEEIVIIFEIIFLSVASLLNLWVNFNIVEYGFRLFSRRRQYEDIGCFALILALLIAARFRLIEGAGSTNLI